MTRAKPLLAASVATLPAGGANPGDQFNQDGRVSGPVSICFHRGAVDEALLKIIQTLF
jgi:hypothetical protein